MRTKAKIKTLDLRETLKDLMQKEVKELPQLLAGLEPKDRIAIFCKLMPYVFPKVDAIHHTANEHDIEDW